MRSELYTEGSTFKILGNDWNELIDETSSNEVFFNWQWHSTWWDHFGKNRKLRVLAVRKEDGVLSGLASCYIELSPDGKRAMKYIGGIDITDYLDIIVRPGIEDEVCKEIMDNWKSIEEEWDFIDLHCLKETSITLKSLKRTALEKGYSVDVALEDVCPKIELPSSWEDYLMLLDKKDRHELKRKIRKFERLPESFVDSRIEDSIALNDRMELFMDLHRKSNMKKKAFMDKDMEFFFHGIAHIMFPKDWIKLSFLGIDGGHAASSLCFDYQNKIYLYNSGYDPQYSYLSPGIVLVGYLIREAIESERCEFDFLRGKESYKYRFGAKDSYIYRMVINKNQ
ncbi:MAG: GNAT family N-acetyltransferase [Thermodesulfobacteriota bacterium]|nr:GNAT family N-acetyltransferase [Thermodesulfobacteriota bacterium]